MHVLLVCSGCCDFVWYISLVWSMVQESMGERDQVWEHGDNLFPEFKCKYCLKVFRGGWATRLKEHLAEKSENISWCSKYPPDILMWVVKGQRSYTCQPELDEKSIEIDAPIPIAIVIAIADPRDLQHRTGSQWARKNIGDSHKGKRKTYTMRAKRQSKRLKEGKKAK
jgi:hypothetical protein